MIGAPGINNFNKLKTTFFYSNIPKDNPELGYDDWIGGISFKTLKKIFNDVVKRLNPDESNVKHSNPDKSNENKKGENGTEIDRKSILNVGELRNHIFEEMKINQLLEIAHAAELANNTDIAVLNRINVTQG